jgi:hypothetical protein
VNPICWAGEKSSSGLPEANTFPPLSLFAPVEFDCKQNSGLFLNGEHSITVRRQMRVE